MLRVVSVDEDTYCAACGRKITPDADAVVVVDPDLDQLVVACNPDRGRNCHQIASSSRVLPCGLLGVVTI